MKKKCGAAQAFLILAFAIGSAAHAADPKEAVNAFHTALTAGDKAKAMEMLAPEVTIYESGYVERSRKEYADHHLGADINFAKTATRKVLHQGEKIEGNTAVVWQETETTGKANGKDVHLFGTETTLLEKRGDAWVITHVHWSSRKAK